MRGCEVRRCGVRGAARVIAVVFAAALGVSAQSPQPSFEVASVKPNMTGDNNSLSRNLPGGGFSAVNVDPRRLIIMAYGLNPSQVVGGPDWIDRERFDIAARAPGGTPSSETMPMLRALLKDRFNLVTHIEMREQPVFALTVARGDGRLGAEIKPSSVDCSAATPGGAPCSTRTSTSNLQGTMIGTGRTMADIAAALTMFVASRIVVDRTGLPGTFDFQLRWTSDSPSAAALAADDNRPSIVTAVQEQLGLKLEAQRAPVETLVIDSISRPTPD